MCSDSCENYCNTREKVPAKCSCKSPFSEYLGTKTRVPNAMLWNFNMSNGQTRGTKWWKKKRGWRQNSKKGFEKNEHACSVEGVFVVLDPSARRQARLYLKVSSLTRRIQSSFKLRQVRKWKAEILTRSWGSLASGRYPQSGGHPEECNIPHQIAGQTRQSEECRGMQLTWSSYTDTDVSRTWMAVHSLSSESLNSQESQPSSSKI